MSQTTNVITIFVYAISVILHSLGFALLTRIKKTDTFGETQRLYLLNLSFTSAIYAGLAVVEEVCLVLNNDTFVITLILDGFLYTWYIFIMAALTFDRFLTLYLKLRYISVWKIKSTIGMLVACCTASITLGLVLFLTHSTIDALLTTLTLFVWPFLDFMFLFVAFFTYGYLMKTFRRNDIGIIVPATIKNLVVPNVRQGDLATAVAVNPSCVNSSSTATPVKNIAFSLRKTDLQGEQPPTTTVACCNINNSTPQSPTKKTVFSLRRARRGFIVPSLLVSSFIVCWLIPDLIYFSYKLSGDEDVKYSQFVDFLYPFGVFSDAIIYILCWKDTRRELARLVRCK